MYSQTMQTRYTGARVLYAFHEHTGSHLFPRRILTPVKAKAAKCAFQFWFDDLKEMTVVDECSCGTLSRMLSGRNHKKNIEIHQPYAGSASWLLSCTFLASLFFSDGPIYWTRNWGTSRCHVCARFLLASLLSPPYASFIAGLRLALQALQRRGRSRHIAASTLSQLGNKIRSHMSFTAKSRFTVALRFSMLSMRKENCIYLLHVKRA